ncbi:hypothetical protein Mapa_017037 [Marchantia paleacea]|nr:hypothetical protein Mapa_017037 [Marchantia paleacea]
MQPCGMSLGTAPRAAAAPMASFRTRCLALLRRVFSPSDEQLPGVRGLSGLVGDSGHPPPPRLDEKLCTILKLLNTLRGILSLFRIVTAHEPSERPSASRDSEFPHSTLVLLILRTHFIHSFIPCTSLPLTSSLSRPAQRMSCTDDAESLRSLSEQVATASENRRVSVAFETHEPCDCDCDPNDRPRTAATDWTELDLPGYV